MRAGVELGALLALAVALVTRKAVAPGKSGGANEIGVRRQRGLKRLQRDEPIEPARTVRTGTLKITIEPVGGAE